MEVRAVNVVPLTDKSEWYMHKNQNWDDYSGNEDLECISSSSQRAEFLEKTNKYDNSLLYKFYKSPWQTSAIYSCSTSRMSKITSIALAVVAMSLGVMAALYMARKKYNKMANINCTLPAGLETYLTKETNTSYPGDFGNGNQIYRDTRTAEDQWISAARMQEFNFRNEQHHHLLASLGTDSGYLAGGVESGPNNSNNIINRVALESNLETSEVSENRRDYIQDYAENNFKVSSTTELSLADSLVENAEKSDCQNIFTGSNGYIQSWQTFNDQYGNNVDLPIIPIITGGSYVTTQTLNCNPFNSTSTSPNNNDYVLQEDLQNLFNKTVDMPLLKESHKQVNIPQINNNGYTTLENLTKLNINSSLATHSENDQKHNHLGNINTLEACGGISAVSTDTEDVKSSNISGYVTQHDLNLFAQHQQYH